VLESVAELATALQAIPIPTEGTYITFKARLEATRRGWRHARGARVGAVGRVCRCRRATKFGWLIPRPHQCPESTTRGTARVLPSVRADRHNARACIHSAVPVHCTGSHGRKSLSYCLPFPPFTMPYHQLSMTPRAIRARRRWAEERAVQEAEDTAATAAAAASAAAASVAAECGVCLNTAPPLASVWLAPRFGAFAPRGPHVGGPPREHGAAIPGRGAAIPGRGTAIPGRGSAIPGRGTVTPERGAPQAQVPPLDVRRVDDGSRPNDRSREGGHRVHGIQRIGRFLHPLPPRPDAHAQIGTHTRK